MVTHDLRLSVQVNNHISVSKIHTSDMSKVIQQSLTAMFSEAMRGKDDKKAMQVT